MSNLVFGMLHLKEHSKNYDNAAYFNRLINDYYPQRLEELESLHHNLLVMDERATVPQLVLEKLISEISTLWRAEKHYWSMSDDMLQKLKFPKDYIVKKQRTISNLINNLRSFLFARETTESREKVLDVLSDYIEIEYKLNGLLIEKERRINEISSGETG